MWRHGRDQADFSEEIRAHLEMETDRLRGEGLSEADAYAQARREFGNVTRAEERFYESNRLFLAAENVLRDLRYSIRGLRKSPAFTALVVTVLASGLKPQSAGVLETPGLNARRTRLSTPTEQGSGPRVTDSKPHHHDPLPGPQYAFVQRTS